VRVTGGIQPWLAQLGDALDVHAAQVGVGRRLRKVQGARVLGQRFLQAGR